MSIEFEWLGEKLCGCFLVFLRSDADVGGEIGSKVRNESEIESGRIDEVEKMRRDEQDQLTIPYSNFHSLEEQENMNSSWSRDAAATS